MPENLRLRHDCAWTTATACLDPIAYCFGEPEQRQLHRLFYEAVQAALAYYDRHAARESAKLTPSCN